MIWLVGIFPSRKHLVDAFFFFFLSCNVVVNVLFLSAFFIVYFRENSLFIYHVRIIDIFNFRFSSLFPLLTKAQLHRRSLSLSVAAIFSLFPSHIPLSFILPDLFFTIPPSPLPPPLSLVHFSLLPPSPPPFPPSHFLSILSLLILSLLPSLPSPPPGQPREQGRPGVRAKEEMPRSPVSSWVLPGFLEASARRHCRGRGRGRERGRGSRDDLLQS